MIPHLCFRYAVAAEVFCFPQIPIFQYKLDSDSAFTPSLGRRVGDGDFQPATMLLRYRLAGSRGCAFSVLLLLFLLKGRGIYSIYSPVS